MDQRQIVKLLEEHFRKEDKDLHDHRKRLHEERVSISDEEWWDELIERTRAIRPQMVEVFERNKEDMILKRFHTISSEEDFRERMIQKRVMELLPFVSAVRAETEETELTDEHIRMALLRKTAKEIESSQSKAVVRDPHLDSERREDSIDFIDNLIKLQLKRKEELN